jgi:TFIIF-interacting CTD phosphatase-like protein
VHMQIKKSQTQTVRNIFVDLDETLIHTNLASEPNEVPEVEVQAGFRHSGIPDIYNVSLRPGAIELLAALRAIGSVYMLTRAVQEYAEAMSNTFNLGFTEKDIYSRKVVRNYYNEELDLKGGPTFLIDDLPEFDNYEKVELISQLGPVKYINIKSFYGFKDQALTSGYIKDIANKIVTA